VAELRTEYLANPLAIEALAPRLSWVLLAPGLRGVTQSAYQIEVASTAADLAADKVDLWNSGKVTSDRQNQIVFEGRPLTSREHVFWKVRIWDQSDSPSAWSAPATWGMGLLDRGDWSAQWIGDSSSSSSTNVAVTTLRRRFTLAGSPTRAIVYASALGVYELHINGQRVGDHVLAPEFTDYHIRTQYQAYDVTSLLHPGENVIAAWLGDGWYAGGIGLAQALVKQRRNIYGDHPRFLAQLEVTTLGGATRIVTDSSWRVTRDGPIRSSDLLNGEEFDARREMPGWDAPGFVDTGWSNADVAAGVSTELMAQPNEPVRVTADITPIAVSEPKPGVYVFDLGQNMVGWTRIAVQGAAGSTITLSHAEMLDDSGMVYTDNLRGAEQTDRFTLRGTGARERFEPHFTYHGFRYVQLTGLTTRPALTDLTGRQVNSDLGWAGVFATSSPLLNTLWHNVVWTQRDNMIGIPTDCPQRDERLGWMGDIQVFSGTSMFNADMAAFFTKWLRDVRDAQTPDGRFADFSPQPFRERLDSMHRGDFTGVPGWGDAGVVVPWRMWQQYGDLQAIRDNYDAAKKWVDYIHRNNADLLWTNRRGNDYGDWLNADTENDSTIPRKGGEVPKPVFATMMFAYATDIVARMATVLNDEAGAREYGDLFRDIKAAFNRAYVSPDGHIEGDTQAGYALALHFDLLPDSLRASAVRYMVDGIDAYHGHMSTGFHSSYRMMLELSRAGRSDVAYTLVNTTTFPSWGYSIANGATTIWERWDGYVKGRGFQDKGMNSFNHYAIGAVGEWMYRTILGINNDDAHPGYADFVIHPIPGGGLTWARGTHRTIRGTIASNWRVDGNTFTEEVTIPANSLATVYVPAASADRVTESDVAADRAPGVRFVRMEGDAAVYRVGSGTYRFVVKSRGR
jgi:alpha-L-rhamnosidase